MLKLHLVGMMVLFVAAACAVGSCAAADEKAAVALPDAGDSALIRLSYARPRQYDSPGRPSGFELVPNYHTSDETIEEQGSWNDETQTLTATVSLGINSEDLVYVNDDAVPLSIPVPVQAAGNGRLHQIGCPAAVTTVQVCYELSVVR